MSCRGVSDNQPVKTQNSAKVSAVDVRGLEMSYDGVTFMRNITFTIAPGEIMAIMGGVRVSLHSNQSRQYTQ
jgi:ABC-type transport system involved in cytochrome bd biosynthesis fused ATPase/permease subunit